MSFIFKITTTTSPQTFVIPCHNTGTFNATVDYGDGTGSQTVTAYNDSNLTHSFATAGQHTITIDGTFPNIRFFNDAASALLVNEVVDLGDVGWTSLTLAFRDCTNLTSFNGGTTDTSNVYSMEQMFYGCNNLTTLGVSSLDTSSVTNMSYMFFGCSSLTALDVSNFNTASVNTMAQMFRNCSNLTSLDLSNFDTSNVDNMSYMFHTCSSLTALDLTNFDTSSVTTVQQMFLSCSSLTSLNVSSFDTSNVTNMYRVFYNCNNLTNIDVKHFDISSVTNGTGFLQNANNALTTTAYDELLEVWAAQDVQLNVPWHFGNAQYTVEAIADWYSPRNASSLSIINNKLVSIADSTAVFGAGQQVDNLIVGNVYKMKARSTCNNAAATMFLSVSVDATLSPSVIFTQGTSTALIDDLFTATATTMYFGVVVSGHAANDTVTIDAGISVKEVTNYTEANAASEIEYSQENVFGAEEVVNGDFATTDTSYWSSVSYVTITGNGVASIDGTGSSNAVTLRKLDAFNNGVSYSVDITCSSHTSGRLSIYLNDNEVGDITGTGTYRYLVTGDVDGRIQFLIRSGDTILDISNISIKEITNAVEYKNIPQSARELYRLEDDTWVGSEELINGSFADGDSNWIYNSSIFIVNTSGAKHIANAGGGAVQQNKTRNSGTTYLVSVEVFDYVTGSCRLQFGGVGNDFIGSITANGLYEFTTTLTAERTSFELVGGGGATEWTARNVSVKEIIEVAS